MKRHLWSNIKYS